jgi:hypothetical protein
MIGSVTEVQQQMAAISKRRQGPPAGSDLTADPVTPSAPRRAVPQPTDEHLGWAKRVLSNGDQGDPVDRVDAERILEHAGLDPDVYHPQREPDTAPAGARAIAEQLRQREEASLEGRKAYQDRGVTAGPADGLQPGRLDPASVDRPYLSGGHAARAPQSQPPRSSPLPTGPHGITPVQMAADPRATQIPAPVIATYTLASPSER